MTAASAVARQKARDGARKKAILAKLARMRSGEAPRVVDLFAGCGGISLGAQRVGCQITAAVELDPTAAKSHALNFHGGAYEHALPRNIHGLDPTQFLQEVGCLEGGATSSVDVLVGGPPCQAFARVGRAKLREVAQHPEAFLHDPRSGLYQDYIHFVEELAPVAIVIENVPDVLNFGGLNIFEVVAQALADTYDCVYGLLNSAHYGVPQMRTRCFLIGIAKEVGVKPRLPLPTNYHILPSGYQGTRDVAVKSILPLLGETGYSEAPIPEPTLAPAVTAEDALRDLPKINALSLHARGKLRKGRQDLTEGIPLPKAPGPTGYGRLMREWPGLESDGTARSHVIRFLPRDYKIFRGMRPGDQYPEAHKLALKQFSKALSELPNPPAEGSADFQELMAQYVPPYDPTKFPNKWRKMERDKPARTLMAHIGKDTYSHIHYDSAQARPISVREAARLQSFPDGFQFAGAMNAAFKQIGNAVPPLLAAAVIGELLDSLGIKPDGN